MKTLQINLGCGPNGQLAGFDNLDNSPSARLAQWPVLKRLLYQFKLLTSQQYQADWSQVRYCDASKQLPYSDASVDKIYSSHFLEHIPPTKGKRVLQECYRVLKPHGVMRLVVPDLLWHARHYIAQTEALLAQNSTNRQAHDDFLKTLYGAYLFPKRYGAEHCYMYDLPTLTHLLTDIGFSFIQPCAYQQGIDDELAHFDSRPRDSLHLEIRKGTPHG